MSLLVDGVEYVAWNPETPNEVYHNVERSDKPSSCDPYWKTRCGTGRNFTEDWELLPRSSTGYLRHCESCLKVNHPHPVLRIDSLDEIPDRQVTGSTSMLP